MIFMIYSNEWRETLFYLEVSYQQNCNVLKNHEYAVVFMPPVV